MVLLSTKDDGNEEGGTQKAGDGTHRQGGTAADAAGEGICQQTQQTAAENTDGNGHPVILAQQFFGHMGTDDAHKADDAQERHAHGSDDGCQQQRCKPQPLHIHAHGLGGSLTAEEGVIFPCHKEKEYKTNHSSKAIAKTTTKERKYKDII